LPFYFFSKGYFSHLRLSFSFFFFCQFDEARKGVMTLEDFRYFLVKMSKLEQSDVPSYSISKDMFD